MYNQASVQTQNKTTNQSVNRKHDAATFSGYSLHHAHCYVVDLSQSFTYARPRLRFLLCTRNGAWACPLFWASLTTAIGNRT